MRNIIFIALFLITSVNVFSQYHTNKLDSFLKLMDDETITLKKRHIIGDKAYRLPYPEYMQVLQRLLSYDKKEKDKWGVIYTYSTMYSIIDIYEEDSDKAKLFLDSALVFVDQTEDVGAIAMLYHRLGSYYANFPESEEISHEYLRKAISHYEKSEQYNHHLTNIYFVLANAYINRKDMESTKKVIDKMLKIKLQKAEKVFYINTYSVVADYYQLAKEKDSINYYAYNDSVIHYHEKIIKTYESLLDSVPGLASQKAPILKAYNELARAMADAKDPEWNEIMHIHDKAKIYIDDTAWRNQLRFYATKGTLLLKQKNYADAKTYLLKEKEILDSNEEFDDTEIRYIKLYSDLSLVSEGLNQYKEALEYARLSMSLERDYNENNRYDAIKDIEIKYETAEKELEISKLNEEKQKILYNRTLLIAGLIIALILLFLLLIYNRYLRLKKQKEKEEFQKRIEQKDLQFESIMKDNELKQVQHYINGLEVERDRIAKELHDNVANELLAIDMFVREKDTQPEVISTKIEKLTSLVRNISHELLSPAFQYASLDEVLYMYIETLNQNSQTIFHLDISEDVFIDSLSAKFSLEIYRIIQESTSNIIKHASAKNAWISFSKKDDSIIISIKDDGQGFDIQHKTNGVGLQIIRNRIIQINGECEIESQKGTGTNIIISVRYL